MAWQDNPIMEWSDNGSTWNKITDHGRSPLATSVERIETKQRMANGSLRRYVVAKKRTWQVSWENLASKNGSLLPLASGKPGEWIEAWHNTHDAEFQMRMRDGGANVEIVTVMISDFSKEVVKRTPTFDIWSLDITLEET